MTEREKYTAYHATYNMNRHTSSGMRSIKAFMAQVKGGHILNIGCGSDAWMVKLALSYGLAPPYNITNIDIAPNCRDVDLIHDIRYALPVEGDWGFCTDVLEHIPEVDVQQAIYNIADACREGCYVKVPIKPGKRTDLHLTMISENEWLEKLRRGFRVVRMEYPCTDSTGEKNKAVFWCFTDRTREL